MIEDKVPQRTVYDFLSGKSDTTSEIVWILMEALELTITTKTENLCEREKHMDHKQAEVTEFNNDDKGYKNWLEEHQSGFVVNCWKEPSPKYLVLHRAICGTINTDKRNNWTETDYIKICSESKNTLEDWCRKNVGGTSEACGLCKP
jgi:hypothetical protein